MNTKKADDTRPTVASWPRRISELSTLPQAYHLFLKDWIKKGMNIENIIYIPRIHQSVIEEPEIVLAWYDDEVMILKEEFDTKVQQYLISSKDIVSIDYSLNLLNYYVTINISKGNSVEAVVFQFNKSKEDLLIPILNILLENDINYEMDVFMHENSICDELQNRSYMMYNFSKLSYRLDTTILDYFWEREELSSTSSREKMYTEYFISIMEKGITLIASQFYGVDVTHLYWKNIKDMRIEEESILQLAVETQKGKIYSLPIEPKNIDSARNFLSNFKKCLKEYRLH